MKHCKHCGLSQGEDGSESSCPYFNDMDYMQPHEWVEDPALPTDLDLKRFLSEADAQEIQALSADQKTERTRIFTRAMGKMLADLTGETREEKEAIQEGYQRLLEQILPQGGFPPSIPGGLSSGLSFPFPGAPGHAAMPKFPEPPSGTAIDATENGVIVVDFSKFDSLYKLVIEPCGCNYNFGQIHATLMTDEITLHLTAKLTGDFLHYLQDLSKYHHATAEFMESQRIYSPVPMSGQGYKPALVLAAEIDQLLALPFIQSLLEQPQAKKGTSNA